MSYESVIEHMRRELVAGSTRRGRRERVQRRIGAVVVMAAVAMGAVALVRDNDHTTRVATQPNVGPTTAQSDACDSFLDLTSLAAAAAGSPTPAAIEQFAALADASGDTTLAKSAATIRDNYPRVPTTAYSQDVGQKLGSAYKDVTDHCRAIGVADFNPIYVPASTGPAPRVDLRAYGTEQRLEPVGGRLPDGAIAPQGRSISPVAVAESAEGAFVMAWSYQSGATGQRSACRTFGVNAVPFSMDSGCGPENDPKRLPPSGIQVNGVSSNFGDEATTIQVTDSTSFVVIDRAGEQHVQRPVAGMAVFVWPLDGSPPQHDWVVRAYEPDGVVLVCVASGSRSC